MGRPAKSEAERFMSHVRIVESGCHEWQSKIDKGGYGHFTLRDASTMRAHRYSWLRAVGAIPDGLCVLHKCDNRRCVNPEHLFVGTYRDNVLDMVRKGRNWGRRKLKDDSVKDVLALIANGNLSQTEIASQYGIDQTTVSRIGLGRTRYASQHK